LGSRAQGSTNIIRLQQPFAQGRVVPRLEGEYCGIGSQHRGAPWRRSRVGERRCDRIDADCAL
jgi:hypothetical protein